MNITIDEQRLRRLIAASRAASETVAAAAELLRDRRRTLREAEAELQERLRHNPAGNRPETAKASAAVEEAATLVRAAVSEHERLAREVAPAQGLASRLRDFAQDRRIAI